MKRIIISCASVLLLAISVFAAPTSKLVEQFTKTFPNAENVKWSETAAGYYVGFYQNGNFEKIFYNKNGDFVCSWKYSYGKDLPTNILMLLNKRIGEGTIKGVTETATEGGTNYEIKIAKGNKLYCLSMSADGIINKEEKFDYEDGNNNTQN